MLYLAFAKYTVMKEDHSPARLDVTTEPDFEWYFAYNGLVMAPIRILQPLAVFKIAARSYSS